jgi:hypothetical protein
MLPREVAPDFVQGGGSRVDGISWSPDQRSPTSIVVSDHGSIISIDWAELFAQPSSINGVIEDRPAKFHASFSVKMKSIHRVAILI